MICPKCGIDSPNDLICISCGYVINAELRKTYESKELYAKTDIKKGRKNKK